MRASAFVLVVCLGLVGCQPSTTTVNQQKAPPQPRDSSPEASAPTVTKDPTPSVEMAKPKHSPIRVKLLEVKHDTEADDPLALMAHVEVSARPEVELRAFAAFLVLEGGTRLSLDDAKLNAMGGTPMKIGSMTPLDLPFQAKKEGDESRVSAVQIIATLADGSVTTVRASL